MNSEDIEKIENFDFDKYSKYSIAVQLFLFSYYSVGINLKDIDELRKSDIYGTELRYTRSKTGKVVKQV